MKTFKESIFNVAGNLAMNMMGFPEMPDLDIKSAARGALDSVGYVAAELDMIPLTGMQKGVLKSQCNYNIDSIRGKSHFRDYAQEKYNACMRLCDKTNDRDACKKVVSRWDRVGRKLVRRFKSFNDFMMQKGI